MKSIVVYFSQTGNTEKIAKAIQVGVKKAAGHCDILKIKEANPRHLSEYDLIGIGMPCFAIEPENVGNFVSDMRFVGGKHVFIFSTSGEHPDWLYPHLYPKLKDRGLIAIGYRNWYGSQWLPHCPYPSSTHGHPDEIDLKEAQDFGREMVDHSRRITNGETGLIPPAPAPQDAPPPEWTIHVFRF